MSSLRPRSLSLQRLRSHSRLAAGRPSSTRRPLCHRGRRGEESQHAPAGKHQEHRHAEGAAAAHVSRDLGGDLLSVLPWPHPLALLWLWGSSQTAGPWDLWPVTLPVLSHCRRLAAASHRLISWPLFAGALNFFPSLLMREQKLPASCMWLRGAHSYRHPEYPAQIHTGQALPPGPRLSSKAASARQTRVGFQDC